MNASCNRILLLVIIVAAGIFFRLWRLDERPMHTDESVHAEKFKMLLEDGSYTYDPDEYHGPTLNYLTLISAKLRGQSRFIQVSEVTLRLVPAVVGVLLIFTPLFFVKEFGRRAVLLSCLLTAVSPAFVYYSRYYIQEMLLVFFTACFLGCLWRWLDSGKIAWAVLVGVSAGLMHATKETFVFAIVSVAVAIVFCLCYGQRFKRVKFLHIAVGLLTMIVVSGMLFSSFGINPQGIVDSILTYGHWADRAGGNSCHLHPWCYYLDLLTWAEFFEPICWNEDAIIALGGACALLLFVFRSSGLRNNGLFVFFVIYTTVLTLIYHLIPYKTPWCMLSFLYGMAILAGVVIDWMVKASTQIWQKGLAGFIIVVFVVGSPVYQCWMLNFELYADTANPYVYGHTSNDVYEMVDAVEKAAGASDGVSTPIYVIANGDDYWPMPWYLRGYDKVGYFDEPVDSSYMAQIVMASADVEDKLLGKLYSVPEPGKKNLYVPLFNEPLYLRPGVEWKGYVRKDLRDKMDRQNQSPQQTVDTVNGVSESSKSEIENVVKLSHQAMNTDFQIFIQDIRGSYAGRAARAAFNEVDRLEGLLSRFRANSDVSRINALKRGEVAIVDEDTFKCLQIAKEVWELTYGCFDVTIGEVIGENKDGGKVFDMGCCDMSMLVLEPGGFGVEVTNENVSIDLGGIGKGYAVDVIADVLKEWGIDKALISAGASSVMALDSPEGKDGWPITISNPEDESVIECLSLCDEVLSSSGTKKGSHIVDPSTGLPVKGKQACWVRIKGTAAMADALSTAVMIMDDDQVAGLTGRVKDLKLMIVDSDGDVENFNF